MDKVNLQKLSWFLNLCKQVYENAQGFIKITHQGSTFFANTELFRTLSRSKRQSENHCALPDHPYNGEIKLLGQEKESYLPNSNVMSNTIIDLSCRGDTVTETGGLSRAICDQGKWKPPISQMGGCVRRCPQVQPEEKNLSLICKHKNPRINCNNPIEGTVIQVVCKPFHEYVGLQPIILCRDGTWDSEISSCQPECKKKRKGVGVDSTTANSEYPSIAGIFESDIAKQFHGRLTVTARFFVLSGSYDISDVAARSGQRGRRRQEHQADGRQFLLLDVAFYLLIFILVRVSQRFY